MSTMYCALCGRPVAARRHVGAGTIALGVITGGLWFLAVPFFPKRCPICLSRALSPSAPDGRPYTPGTPSALQSRLAELERRLSLTEGELEAANDALDRVRTERDFYRQLLDDPTRRQKSRPDPE